VTKVPGRGEPNVEAGGDRRARLVGLLVGGANNAFGTKRLCQVCAEVTAMGGAGIMLMADDAPRRSLCTTNEMSDLIEQLQYALDEGPCVDAYRQERPVIEPDLVGLGTRRWLAFAPAAIEAGVRAVFGFPLKVGAVRLGALNLCRDRPGPLNDDQHANALVIADLAAEAALVLQASAARVNLAADRGASRDSHYVVHQAGGVVAAQLDPSVG
jgi:GAF domain-containing protein